MVGRGMLDVAVAGAVFTSPTALQVREATRAAEAAVKMAKGKPVISQWAITLARTTSGNGKYAIRKRSSEPSSSSA